MADHWAIERVHLFPVERLLNVSSRTPSALVYGETGRYHLNVITVKCINYCLNFVRKPENRLPLKAYKRLMPILDFKKRKEIFLKNKCV